MIKIKSFKHLKVWAVLLLICLTGLAVACQPGGQIPITGKDSPTPAGPSSAEMTSTQQAIDRSQAGTATQQAVAASTATAEFRAAASATANADRKATQAAQQTASVEAARAEATSMAAPMYDHLLELYENQDLSTTEGTYTQLPDFDESWAQTGWYQWWHAGTSPANFVLRAEVFMDTALQHSSGACGIVFREQGTENHYILEVNTAGWASITRVYRDQFKRLGQRSFANQNVLTRTLDLTLIADGTMLRVYVDGLRRIQVYDDVFSSGDLGLAVISNTNRDFGTRCKMSNIELWELK